VRLLRFNMADNTDWVYDPNKPEHCFVSASDEVWTYESEARINPNGSTIDPNIGIEPYESHSSSVIDRSEETERGETEGGGIKMISSQFLKNIQKDSKDHLPPPPLPLPPPPPPPLPAETLTLYCSPSDKERPIEYFRTLATQKYGLRSRGKPLKIRFTDETYDSPITT
jgi:hypothetical protein